jgi:hypothetical protein
MTDHYCKNCDWPVEEPGECQGCIEDKLPGASWQQRLFHKMLPWELPLSIISVSVGMFCFIYGIAHIHQKAGLW